MKIMVFGGTGSVGEVIVRKLSGAGIKAGVLTRQTRLPLVDHIQYMEGNVLDETAAEACLEQNDQVIISLGFNQSDLDTMSRGTLNIVKAMQRKGCSRLICLSAQGVGDSWRYMPDDFKMMVDNDPVLKSSFHDHGLQENIVKSSGLAWTIVRPMEIVDTGETGDFAVNIPPDQATFQISKYDVAQFIIDELKENKFVRDTVMITA